jgi:hypothetical protein
LLAKLNAIDETATPNVKSDWNEIDPTSDAYILNKPLFDTGQVLVGAEWTGAGLIFDVYADAFPINDAMFPATPDTVTLDAADATLDRIDLIVAIAPISPATVGTVGKITGTPASPSLVVPPDYDPSIYYIIKQITVKAAATVPFEAANTQIYNEGTEWTVTLSANVVQNTSDPSVGVNCLEATNWTNSDSMLFTAPAPLSTGDLDLLTFDFKVKEILIKKNLAVTIINGTNRLATVFFRSGVNFFDDQNLSYQTIKIDKAFLNLNIETFDAIEIKYYTPTTGFYFDNFKLFKGSGSEVVPNTGIPEAPSDGEQYARKDGSWAVVTTGAGDMLASVYDPTAVSGDAFSTNNMKEPTIAKTTPIDADTVTLWDSVSTSFKKLSWANIKTALNLIYAPKFGTRVINATVTGTYAIDHNAGNDFKLTMTGATTFSDSNLPTGINTIELTIKLTGAFVPTFPAYWDVLGDTYNGTGWNFIAVQVHNGTTSSEEITAFITNF